MMSETISANFDGQQLFAIVETRIEKYPYAEENDEYMPDFLRVYSESTEIDYDAKCRIRHLGSPSMRSTFFPAWASPIPKLAQVVVLPTPPFWFVMAMICVFKIITSFLGMKKGRM